MTALLLLVVKASLVLGAGRGHEDLTARQVADEEPLLQEMAGPPPGRPQADPEMLRQLMVGTGNPSCHRAAHASDTDDRDSHCTRT